ncbi:carbohydrate porin [Moellerella wisconsensis]|uniref:Carbohydrate porin n=2 Tax=Gammaproteobacteria TaxID=1236 RepID=A0ACD3Y709_9GAMM|nr:carbohydrate porin [Moellerella wisconsensis]UNH38598.1 carbohydrate porin [Moellerella wisconsensis]
MKAISLTMVAGSVLAALSMSATADTDLSRIEARLQVLEQRAAQAEARATAAEQKAQRLEQMMMAAPAPAAPATVAASAPVLASHDQQPAQGMVLHDDKLGELKLYGDVEFNMDGASKQGQISSVRTALGKNSDAGKSDNWDINGRILIGLDGERELHNGNYAGFTVQPLADLSGSMNLDDAAFYFGQKDNWEVKLGRYEAYDMFPLGQDTFVEYSGNTSNDLYEDGFGYIYMMKEGRGRSGDGGSVQISKSLDNWYFELNALVEEGTSLFGGEDPTYHGYELKNKKNVIYMRPVIAWQQDSFKVAAGMESQVINNAYGAYANNGEGKWKDMSKRNGYGLTLAWDTLENDPDNGIVATLSTAYMDATGEKDFTAGGNILWRKAQLGYIYAHNDIRTFNTDVLNSDNSSLNAVPGKYDLHTVFVSYEIPKILDLDNYKIYLGGYYSKIDADQKDMVSGRDDDRYGVRARFKYFF